VFVFVVVVEVRRVGSCDCDCPSSCFVVSMLGKCFNGWDIN